MMYTPRYTDWQAVQARARTLLVDATEESLAPFIAAAEAWIDNKLRWVYRLPLSTVDPIIREVAASEAAALAIADEFSNRGRDDVTLAMHLHQWAEESLDYAIKHRTLTAEQYPHRTGEARPFIRTTTPGPSPMQGILDQAFRYQGRRW